MENSDENSNKKKEIISKYNSTSHFYDKRYLEIQQEKCEFFLKKYLLGNKLLLDAGCGTGILFNFLFKSLAQVNFLRFSYVGVDISFNMLLKFKIKLKETSEYVRINYNLVLTDIENLPFRRNSFNSIISLTSLQNLPSIGSGLRELLRVGKSQADVRLSILKKKITKEELELLVKELLENYTILTPEDIEDFFIQGQTLKTKI